MATTSKTVTTPARHPHLRLWLRRIGRALLIFFVLLLAAAVGLYWYIAKDLPSPAGLNRPPAQSTLIYDRDGRLLYEISDPAMGHRTVVPLAEMPLALRNATIATEDADFYSNPGFDAGALLRALWQNLGSGRVVSGGSTITQQLVRAALFSDEEQGSVSYWRKAREVVLAFQVSQKYGKDDILAMYLNQIYYGNASYGVEAAAQSYFGVAARDLDLAECAMLAGLPAAPNGYNPLTHPAEADARRRQVLDLMVKRGYISQAQADAAAAEQLHYAGQRYDIKAPHFVMYVREQLEAKYGREMVERGGLRVYTTLSLPLQDIAQRVATNHLVTLKQDHVSNAALVALDPNTNQIVAMLGSADYFDPRIDGEVNVALAPRQPGSSMKPITYAAALAGGATGATLLPDIPTTYPDRDGSLYMPLNYDGLYHGPVTLRMALANSYNVPSVALESRVGVDTVLKLARSLGLTTLDSDPTKYGLSLTLGGGEVRLLDLTAAYATFRNGGQYAPPTAILRVEDSSGRVLEQYQPPQRTAMLGNNGEQVAYILTSILSDNFARIPSFGRYSPLYLDRRPAAAKTGTTTNFRDNWTMGYTMDYVVGVWVGNNDNTRMEGSTGVTGAAPIWHDFMQQASVGLPARDFPRPTGLRDVEVCALSGLLPTQYCSDTRSETFIAGTEPTLHDNFFQPFKIDRSNGLLATRYTPPADVVEKVYAVLPPEYSDWVKQQGWPQPPISYSTHGNIGPGATATVITAPQAGQYISGRVEVRGQLPAGASNVALFVGRSGDSGGVRVPLASPADQASAILAYLDAGGMNGSISLRLSYTLDGQQLDEQVPLVADSVPPRAGVLYPTNGATFSIGANAGLPEPFTADAADNFAVDNVQYFVDGQPYDRISGDGPYTVKLHLDRLTPGLHSLYVIVSDKAGNQTRSETVDINITP
jgi:1A family penicillin-binding protein